MRIVAGSAKGRLLAGPKGEDVIRPTSDRVRQALFNVLGQWCEGLTVLDLFAGTGALALEALSRGAAKAVLVDSGREALALCAQNAKALGFEAQVEVLASTFERALPRLKGRRFELVFADPPYALQAGRAVLEGLLAHELLAPGATVVVEHARQEVLAERVGALERVDERTYGDTHVSIFRLTGPST